MSSVAWMKARDDRNETENISTVCVKGMVHVRDVDVSTSSGVIMVIRNDLKIKRISEWDHPHVLACSTNY